MKVASCHGKKAEFGVKCLDEIQLLDGHANLDWLLVAHVEHVRIGIYGLRGPFSPKTLSKILNQNSQYQHPNFQKFFIFIDSAGSIQKCISFRVRRIILYSELDF